MSGKIYTPRRPPDNHLARPQHTHLPAEWSRVAPPPTLPVIFLSFPFLRAPLSGQSGSSSLGGRATCPRLCRVPLPTIQLSIVSLFRIIPPAQFIFIHLRALPSPSTRAYEPIGPVTPGASRARAILLYNHWRHRV